MFIVYKYTSPSGKHYIGITNDETRRKQEHRKKENIHYQRNEKFANCIKKYGYDNLVYSVLANDLSLEDAKYYEQYYIKRYDSYSNGYNHTIGGDWQITRAKLTEEDVKNIRKDIEQTEMLMQNIAKKYNISPSVVSDIKNNRRWKHLEGARVIRKKHWFNVGSDNQEAKLNEKLVKEIKLKLSQGISRKELQEEYNVSKTNIQMIATGESWSHVIVSEYKYKKVRNGNAKLNEDTVRLIWKDRKEGFTQKQLVEKYEVSRSTIQNLLKGKVWKDIYQEMKEGQ